MVYLIIRYPKSLVNIFRYFGRKICGLPSLRNVEIGLTYDCQCNCKHCYVKEYKKLSKKYLSVKKISRILKECSKLGAFHVNFTGGEPLLRKDIDKIIKNAKKQGYIVSITTNGLKFEYSFAKKLKSSGLDVILFSLDSPYANIHDTNRKVKNCYSKVMEGLKIAKKLKILCFINYTFTHKSFETSEIEKMYNLARKLDVFLNLVPPVFIGGLKQTNNEYLTNLDRIKFFRFIKHKKVWSDILSGFFTGCDAGKEKIGINPYGFVTPCPAIPEIFGNCKNEKIKNIWKKIIEKEEYNKFHNFCYANLKTNPRKP